MFLLADIFVSSADCINDYSSDKAEAKMTSERILVIIQISVRIWVMDLDSRVREKNTRFGDVKLPQFTCIFGVADNDSSSDDMAPRL